MKNNLNIKIREIAKSLLFSINGLRHLIEGSIVFNCIKKYGPFLKLLDAGAGGGAYSHYILSKKLATYIVACEIDGKNFNLLKARLSQFTESSTIYNTILEDIPIPSESCDAVICNQVLEHINDDVIAAKKLTEYLKPSGILIVSVPRLPIAKPQMGHVRDGYTENDLQNLFAPLGMELLETDWFYTKKTMIIRSIILTFSRYKIYLPRFLFHISELHESPADKYKQDPAALLMVFRKIKR